MDHPLFAGEQRRQDLLNEAAEARLAAQARMSHRQPGQHAALAWLGEQMIAWGWRLRARYGNVEHRQVA